MQKVTFSNIFNPVLGYSDRNWLELRSVDLRRSICPSEKPWSTTLMLLANLSWSNQRAYTDGGWREGGKILPTLMIYREYQKNQNKSASQYSLQYISIDVLLQKQQGTINHLSSFHTIISFSHLAFPKCVLQCLSTFTGASQILPAATPS